MPEMRDWTWFSFIVFDSPPSPTEVKNQLHNWFGAWSREVLVSHEEANGVWTLLDVRESERQEEFEQDSGQKHVLRAYLPEVAGKPLVLTADDDLTLLMVRDFLAEKLEGRYLTLENVLGKVMPTLLRLTEALNANGFAATPMAVQGLVVAKEGSDFLEYDTLIPSNPDVTFPEFFDRYDKGWIQPRIDWDFWQVFGGIGQNGNHSVGFFRSGLAGIDVDGRKLVPHISTYAAQALLENSDT